MGTHQVILMQGLDEGCVANQGSEVLALEDSSSHEHLTSSNVSPKQFGTELGSFLKFLLVGIHPIPGGKMIKIEEDYILNPTRRKDMFDWRCSCSDFLHWDNSLLVSYGHSLITSIPPYASVELSSRAVSPLEIRDEV